MRVTFVSVTTLEEPLFRKLLSSAVLLVLACSVYAAEFQLISTDAPGVGINDTTPFTPVGKNSATTKGEARRVAIEYAMNLLGRRLSSAEPIKVRVAFRTMGSYTLGIGTSLSFHENFPGAPVANRMYPAALANALAGYDLNPNNEEILFYINQNTNFYLGLDAAGGGSQPDLVTVVLHELIHGLGMQTTMNPGTGEWQFGSPDAYSSNLVDRRTGTSMLNLSPQKRLSVSYNFAGTNTKNFNRSHPEMSDASHWGGWALFGPRGAKRLLNSGNRLFSGEYYSQHNFELELNVMKDIGWTVHSQRSFSMVFVVQDGFFSRTFMLPRFQLQAFVLSLLQQFRNNDTTFRVVTYQEFPEAPFSYSQTRPYRVLLNGSTSAADVLSAYNKIHETEVSLFPSGCMAEGLYQTLAGKGIQYATSDYSDPSEIRPSSVTDADFNLVLHQYFPVLGNNAASNANYPTADINPLAADWSDVYQALSAKHNSVFLFNLPQITLFKNGAHKTEDMSALEKSFEIVAGGTFDGESADLESVMETTFNEIADAQEAAALDTDEDGTPDVDDNCPEIANYSQADINNDGIGDVCDAAHPGFCSGIRATSGDLTLAAKTVVGSYQPQEAQYSEEGTVQLGGKLNAHKRATVEVSVQEYAATATDAVSAPESLISQGDLIVSGREGVTLTSGIYVYDNIVIKSNSKLTTDGPVQIWFTGSLTVNSNSEVVGFENDGRNLTFFSSEGAGDINVRSNAFFNGQIYAPNANFALHSNSDFYGNLVARDIVIDANSAIYMQSIDCE